MKKWTVILAAAAAGLIGLMLLVREWSAPPATQPRTFTVATSSWPAWDTFRMGVRRRERDVEEFQTRFIQEKSYTGALDTFREPETDAATLTIYEALQVASQGTPIEIVLLLDYTTGSDALVAKTDIRTLTDLKGASIGVEKGTIAHFTALKALEKAGLRREDVTLTHLPLDMLQQAFIEGRVDAAGTYEPYLSRLISEGDGHALFTSDEIPREICDVLFVKERVIRNNPDIVDHWIEAWSDVQSYRTKRRDSWLQTLSDTSGTPVAQLEDSLNGIYIANMPENRRAFGMTGETGYLDESLRQMQDFMHDQGVIDHRVPVGRLLYPDGVRRFFSRRQ